MSDAAKAPEAAPGVTMTAVKVWAQAYRVELILFAVSFFALTMFSGQRFLRQSAAPHFVYQAKAWLDGRQDIDAEVLPNFEDWACVRDVNGVKQRCTQPLLRTDKWFSSFPMFPSAVMAPFVALHGYQFNDTSFGVFIGALAIALFYSVLRLLSEHEGSGRNELENAALAVILGFGTLFFYCAIRGEVWFSAEVMGVALTCLYVRNATGARRPLLSGVFWSMAVLTRTPLLFTGIFFLLEAIAPTPGKRRADVAVFFSKPGELFKTKLQPFLVGAAPLAVIAMAMNQTRFGSIAEFGHRFFFENRVNQDIDTFGLFHPTYFSRNFEAAFLLVPKLNNGRLEYSPWGMSLLLTLPALVLLVMPKEKPRLHWPLWLTVGACALPGLFYQNTGYAQFGFRFSLDYTPYLLLLLAVGGWSLKKPLALGLLALGVVVNFWGALGFKGYTELVRGW
jgi:hypothetical protein